MRTEGEIRKELMEIDYLLQFYTKHKPEIVTSIDASITIGTTAALAIQKATMQWVLGMDKEEGA